MILKDILYVWKEVIIMLPSTITMVFLMLRPPRQMLQIFLIGLDVSNKKMFFLISTNKRPVPLIHYLYYNSEIMLGGDRSYNYSAISQITKLEIERNPPKPKSVENSILTKTRKSNVSNTSSWKRV
jgi:superfamily II RNA helicase